MSLDGTTIQKHNSCTQTPGSFGACRPSAFYCGLQFWFYFAYGGAELTSAGKVFFRQEGETIPDHAQIRYYISSEVLTAERFAQAVRQYLHVENKLHWSLDVAFKDA